MLNFGEPRRELGIVRKLWSRKGVIIWTVGACVLGALIPAIVMPPQWSATARVTMNASRPDPVTDGARYALPPDQIVETQLQLMRDQSVAGRVVDRTGWLSDPSLIASYQQRRARDQRDFRQWLADKIIGSTEVGQADDSDVLFIRFTATSPQMAKALAGLIRTAYLENAAELRRDDSLRTADWLEKQLDEATRDLVREVLVVSEYEKKNNVVMLDDTIDLESEKLRAMAEGSGREITAAGAPSYSSRTSSSESLAQLDAKIATASTYLGVNHPQMTSLLARRSELASEERDPDRSDRYRAVSHEHVDASDREIKAQSAKVIAGSTVTAKLQELQREVEIRRARLSELFEKAQEYKISAAAVDTGLSELGQPIADPKPSFPNMIWSLAGGFALGLSLGVLVALLIELLTRRVRGVSDIRYVKDLEFLIVVPKLPSSVVLNLQASAPNSGDWEVS